MILDDIAAKTRERVIREKAQISMEEMVTKAKEKAARTYAKEEVARANAKEEIARANAMENVTRANAMEKETPFAFEKALSGKGMHFICEVKKASPSKGIISEDFPYLKIAKDYESAGADCISVLTEPDFFLGDNLYLTEIKNEVHLPLLRKDFIIDEYQIYQAKVIGADCVLLIAALLSEETIRNYISICDSLGMSALVEAHDDEEITAASKAGARMIGINNRNLKTFAVNIQNSLNLRELVDKDIIFVAESGISARKDVEIFEQAEVNAVLVGEALMKSEDKKKKLTELRGDC